MKRKLSPLPYEAGECSSSGSRGPGQSSGSRRPGHPHSTPWSCERAKIKLTTHVMQDSTLCPRQYLHAPLLCWGALCRGSHQPGKYGIKTKIKNRNRFNSRQAVRSNPFMSKKPQVEVNQGSKSWLTSTLKLLDLPGVACKPLLRSCATTP